MMVLMLFGCESKVDCPICQGTGTVIAPQGDMISCLACKGDGKLPKNRAKALEVLYGPQSPESGDSSPENNSSTSEYYAPLPSSTTTYPCGVCNSTGICLQCGGTGISPNHASGIKANCGYCGGTGKCGTCHGKGYN